MKLYAITKGDRASKGQGSNKELQITLQIDPIERKKVGRVVMSCYDNTYEVYYYPINTNCDGQKINSGRVLLYQSITKGKKQKTANEH
jgi:hypothetical protein